MFINPLRGSSSPKLFAPERCSLRLSIQSQVIGYGRPLRDEDDPLWTTGLGVDLVNFDLLFVHFTRGSCFLISITVMRWNLIWRWIYQRPLRFGFSAVTEQIKC